MHALKREEKEPENEQQHHIDILANLPKKCYAYIVEIVTGHVTIMFCTEPEFSHQKPSKFSHS